MATDSEKAVNKKWIVELFKNSIDRQKPKEIDNVDVTVAAASGENFLSTVYRIKITAILGSGAKKDYSIIVKNEIPGSVKNAMDSLSLFPVEIKAYSKILPMLYSLMDEFNDIRPQFSCQCLGYTENTTVVMEDLYAVGYTSIDRTKWQSVEQTQLVLRTVARMHAISKVLIARGQLDTKDRGQNLFLTETPMMRAMFPACLSVLTRVIRTKWDKKWRPVADKLQKLDNICDRMITASKCDEKFVVFNHGDLWSANIMWEFTEYGNTPVSVKFIDWQFAHINSFIVDVVFNLYTSVTPSLRRKNLNLLLETYQEALERNLKFYQYEGYIPTLEDVWSEYHRTAILRFVFVGFCNAITSTGVPGVNFDFGSLFDHGEKSINEDIFAEEKYVTEVGPDLKHFCDAGII